MSIIDLISYLFLIVSIIFFIYTVLKIYKQSNVSSTICNNNECITNILTGEKFCDSKGDNIPLDFYTCNPKNSCTSPLTPYALYDNKQGTISNTCPNNVECKCVSQRYCPDYISTFFQSVNVPVIGLPNDSRLGVLNYLVMDTRSYTPLGTPSSTPPLSPGINGVCTISRNALDRVWPTTLVQRNECTIGRLVFNENLGTFYCTILQEDIECIEPNRLVIQSDGNILCKNML